MFNRIKSWFKRKEYVYPYQLQILASAVAKRFKALENENAKLRNEIFLTESGVNQAISRQDHNMAYNRNYLCEQLIIANHRLDALEKPKDGAVPKRKRSPSATKK